MIDVCHNIGIEPPLQSVTNERATDLPTLKKGHASTSRRRGFGGETVDNVYFLTYGFSTHSHTPIVLFPCQRATEGTNKKKEEPTTNVSERMVRYVTRRSVVFRGDVLPT